MLPIQRWSGCFRATRLALASEAKHVLNGTDVVDTQTFSIFRTQTTQTQRTVEAAMTELGWLDDATAERA